MDHDSAPSSDELYPLALLIDELKHDDVTFRLNAMHRLSTIALALGKDRTRSELVPFLEEVTQEDEDEVLAVLAEELGAFVPYVGGPQYAHILISPLEALASVEEPVVRDKAVASLNILTDSMPVSDVEQYVLPLIRRLSSTEWFSSRVSATGLYARAVARASATTQAELQSLYKDLTQDEAPMVRRAAATNLPALIEVLPEVRFEGVVYMMFQAQVLDEQDSVRLLSVDVLIAIADSLRKASVTKYNSELISFTTALFNDKSWRVRYMAADRFDRVAKALDSAELRERFVPAFVKLTKDNEAEVRTAIAKQVPGFAALIPQADIVNELIPTVEALSSDASQHVRAALASEISQLAPLLGKDQTIEHLLPTFLTMLKDDFPDVRLNIISKLQVVNEVIGIDLLSKSLLPAISELAKDKQWRVRLAIIEYIPLLAQQLGVEFFDRELGPLCMTWLWDSVYSIREAATQNLRKLAEVFGVDWAKTEILPHIISVGTNANYLYRLTALFAVSTLIPVLDRATLTDSVLPFVVQLVSDPIPNIRFNTAKTFRVMADAYKKNDEKEPVINDTIIPKLEGLSQDDPDVDVRYFAKQSLDHLRS
uniref:ARAD1D35772p n=1 Tax=Blastobotrys adeninivorans TaxID=409370 RepID=A0A060TI29_BLAAD